MLHWNPLGSRAPDSKDEDEIRVVSYTGRWKRRWKAGNL